MYTYTYIMCAYYACFFICISAKYMRVFVCVTAVHYLVNCFHKNCYAAYFWHISDLFHSKIGGDVSRLRSTSVTEHANLYIMPTSVITGFPMMRNVREKSQIYFYFIAGEKWPCVTYIGGGRLLLVFTPQCGDHCLMNANE